LTTAHRLSFHLKAHTRDSVVALVITQFLQKKSNKTVPVMLVTLKTINIKEGLGAIVKVAMWPLDLLS
jgi:hypothetical protein